MEQEEFIRTGRIIFAHSIISVLTKVGVSPKSLTTLFNEEESDWVLIIKLHTVVEASLNHLIVTCLGDVRLTPIISKLDTSDRSRGKLAFVKALDLLSEPCRRFIRQLSELRNGFAHRATNLDTNIKDYIGSRSAGELKALRESIIGLYGDDVRRNPEQMLKSISATPRKSIILATSLVLIGINNRLHEESLKSSISTPKAP